MRGFTQVVLVGNLTRDPEVRVTPNGTSVADFSVAVNNKFTGKDGELKEEVSFIDVVTFGKQAESCGNYLSKGKGALVVGRLKQERWETEDGQKRNRIRVMASQVQFLGTGNGQNPNQMPTDQADAQEDDQAEQFDYQ